MQPWKNGRAAEPDDVPTEALKVDIGTSTDALYGLFEGGTPHQTITKKGDSRVCSNYGGSNFYRYKTKC